jgi:hypothetical protein
MGDKDSFSCTNCANVEFLLTASNLITFFLESEEIKFSTLSIKAASCPSAHPTSTVVLGIDSPGFKKEDSKADDWLNVMTRPLGFVVMYAKLSAGIEIVDMPTPVFDAVAPDPMVSGSLLKRKNFLIVFKYRKYKAKEKGDRSPLSHD